MFKNIRIWHSQFIINIIITAVIYQMFSFEDSVGCFILLAILMRTLVFVFGFKKYKVKLLYLNIKSDKLIINVIKQELVYTIITTLIFSIFILYGNKLYPQVFNDNEIIFYISMYPVFTFFLPISFIAYGIANYMFYINVNGIPFYILSAIYIFGVICRYLSTYIVWLELIGNVLFWIPIPISIFVLIKYYKFLVPSKANSLVNI